MQRGVAGRQVVDQSAQNVGDNGNEGTVHNRDHIGKCLQGMKSHLAVAISQLGCESIKHLPQNNVNKILILNNYLVLYWENILCCNCWTSIAIQMCAI